MPNFSIELGEKFTIPGTIAQITNMIKKEVLNFLKEREEEYCKFFSIPITWDWRLEATHYFEQIKFQGSLAKRIRKYLQYKYKVDLSQKDMGQLGEIIRKLKNQQTNFIAEFVDNFEWEAGDFGDFGSCFWEERWVAKDILLENGATPILFYNEENEGVGRAIVINRGNHMVVFNSYGFNLEEVVQMLARYFHCKYKIVEANNRYDNNILLYINDEKTGILSYSTIDGNYYELGISTDNYYKCESCHRYYHINDVRLVNGEIYCELCCEIHDVFICDECDKEYLFGYENATYIVDKNITLCPDCLKKYSDKIIQCENCRASFVEKQNLTEKDGKLYCETCLPNPSFTEK